MSDETVVIRRREEKHTMKEPGKLYRVAVKSALMQAITSEADPHTESRWYQHDGEEFHLVLRGEMDYIVGDNTYHLREGDMLWHPSTLRHRSVNTSDAKAVYLTVGTPPSFQ